MLHPLSTVKEREVKTVCPLRISIKISLEADKEEATKGIYKERNLAFKNKNNYEFLKFFSLTADKNANLQDSILVSASLRYSIVFSVLTTWYVELLGLTC